MVSGVINWGNESCEVSQKTGRVELVWQRDVTHDFRSIQYQ